MVSIHSRNRYEPSPVPDHLVIAESRGIDPQEPKHSIRLASGPTPCVIYSPFLYSYKELNLDLILIRDVC